ncbi:MAG: ATP-binding cassette domain-containing protein [Thermoleophilaceae bacterium]|nr:ATP-binding cassette domain-containing protein [Thermoleophilaceae bacterium]
MPAAIETHALARSFKGDVVAVAGIDLEVAEGEIYAFLGPNGAGKTTTVRMLTTLLAPTGGRASVAGHDVAGEADAVRRSIGVALQEAALDPLMTGRELMLLQATLHALPRAEGRRRAEALLERVDLADAADRRVGTYSGGMRRRLDLASALVHEPAVLFLDEPTTGLDPVSRLTIWEEVQKLNDAGTTVFLTTQYLEEADRLADRVGIIDRGTMAAEDTPAALKAGIRDPRLELTIADGGADRARDVLTRFGEVAPAADGRVSVSLGGGRGQVAAIVRALDDAGLMMDSLDVVEPTLDDVFVAKTGRGLDDQRAREQEQRERSGDEQLVVEPARQ